MKRLVRHIVLLMLVVGNGLFANAAEKPILVDINGHGDFTSIQDAINSLPEKATKHRIIFIKNGIYHEKLFIKKDFVTLIGENKEKTQIRYSLARDIWRCENKEDWGVATLNLDGSDIVLENLTISNDFGFELKEDIHIDCPGDSLNPFKTVRKTGHQMAIRSFNTTRFIARNCIFKAYGGDTVSPWNKENGQFYFLNCEMEGGVDFYCPRGWAYAENCVFNAHGNVAAIWHDGSAVKESKTVLKNCVFKGEDGFKLGRYHRDAQFYLIDCQFPNNMADTPIYLNPSKPQNIIQWGHRVYFSNCHRVGGDYKWFADNLKEAEGSPSASTINSDWVFSGSWHPEKIVFESIFVSNSQIQNAATGKKENKTIDSIAERMLVYQRAIGGWPKAVNEVKVDYHYSMTDVEMRITKADSLHNDATIDNEATSREIKYLVKAFKQTRNINYLKAAEKGINYCLKAQNAKGGWPQYYPDASLYRAQITYNDNAMVNVLNILQDIIENKNGFELVAPIYIEASKVAIEKGITCILKTQIVVNGKLTAWCTQYNPVTLVPEMARKFELISISGNESVAIVRFLMRFQKPTDQVKIAISAAIDWFNAVKVVGFKYVDIDAPALPKGKDRVLLPDSNSVVWARFYEIGTNRPMFSGRDSIKKYSVTEIEQERRIGYGWYGTWPLELLEKDYPNWVKKNSK
ncbi:MAG: pectate lyase [Bacteroidetes bacterium]|nr:pectate lyase [Bacteroidota bacterium]